MLMTRFFAGIFLVSTTGLGAAQVLGQDYPIRTIRIVTGPAGGGQDFTARLIALGLTGSLGQSVIVDNRTVTTAPEVVFKSPA